MFKPLGLLQASRCPDEPCHRPYCFFAHSQSTSAAGPSKPPARPILKLDAAPAKRKGEGDKAAAEGKKAKVESATKAKAGRNGIPSDNVPAPDRADRAIYAIASAPVNASLKQPAARPQAVPARTNATSTTQNPASRPSSGISQQSSGAPSVSREAKDLRASKHPYADRQKACESYDIQNSD